MSAKNPTLDELLRELGYKAGADALKDPRVARFIGKQSGPKWTRVRQLIRKRARRK